jgi:hypothetical protein
MSHDDLTLVTCSVDGTICIWSAAFAEGEYSTVLLWHKQRDGTIQKKKKTLLSRYNEERRELATILKGKEGRSCCGITHATLNVRGSP